MTDLTTLTDQLRQAKAAEAQASAARLAVERQILEHPDVAGAMTDDGTTKVGAIKVTTRLTRSWDAEALDAISAEVNEQFWPFKSKWAEDRRHSRVIEEKHPDLWEKLRSALTVKPGKPSVSIVEEK